mmetsp:Transcript_97447/g.245899  ORF Transcript_97447/g.245899 Transcript_97447/m.245899 type:complete len:301 (+) Transcript_97447:138-1040(+)
MLAPGRLEDLHGAFVRALDGDASARWGALPRVLVARRSLRFHMEASAFAITRQDATQVLAQGCQELTVPCQHRLSTIQLHVHILQQGRKLPVHVFPQLLDDPTDLHEVRVWQIETTASATGALAAAGAARHRLRCATGGGAGGGAALHGDADRRQGACMPGEHRDLFLEAFHDETLEVRQLARGVAQPLQVAQHHVCARDSVLVRLWRRHRPPIGAEADAEAEAEDLAFYGGAVRGGGAAAFFSASIGLDVLAFALQPAKPFIDRSQQFGVVLRSLDRVFELLEGLSALQGQSFNLFRHF